MFGNKIDTPVAVSQLRMPDSRERQSKRAIEWLLDQPGGPLLVVTPNKRFDNAVVAALVGRSTTTHVTWRGMSTATFAGHRVVYAWPDRQHLNDLWDKEADAVVIIEWGENETAEWIADANPTRLLPGETIPPSEDQTNAAVPPLPNGVDDVLASVAAWAAGYNSGLKWNEVDKLKADMMNRPERWSEASVDQVRAKCKELGMRPNDAETVAGLLQRRKDGRRFNVHNTYKNFSFN
ncbi:hypothetical protein [Gordonia jacobaea]|uniref:hypothetical protein n=1 Tax=Gordonia jacobaea TaxID=122202 RepID=UPI003D70897B